MSWKSYTHVTMFDRPYPPEKQAEGLAISQAIVGGHVRPADFCRSAPPKRSFRFPVFAWCMRRKAEIMARMEMDADG